MRTTPVVVGHPFAQDPSEMSFGEGDQPVPPDERVGLDYREHRAPVKQLGQQDERNSWPGRGRLGFV